MEPVLEYLLDHPSVGLYAVVGWVFWWLRGFVNEVRQTAKRLEDHEHECSVRTARIHERIDELLQMWMPQRK